MCHPLNNRAETSLARLLPKRLNSNSQPRYSFVSLIRRLKEQKHDIIVRHARADDVKALTQVLTTLAAFAILWGAALISVHVSYWLTGAAILGISLFTLRAFTLMHECGHG